MVNFCNIRVWGEWICADAYDNDYKVSGHIVVHKTEEIFATDCKEFNQFQKAAWSLVDKVAKQQIKNNACTIAWW